MTIMFFGPIIAALATGVAIYSLLRMLQNSDRIASEKLASKTSKKLQSEIAAVTDACCGQARWWRWCCFAS